MGTWPDPACPEPEHDWKHARDWESLLIGVRNCDAYEEFVFAAYLRPGIRLILWWSMGLDDENLIETRYPSFYLHRLQLCRIRQLSE